MDVKQAVDQLNWLDWTVLGVLLIFMISGTRRGLLLGLIDLLGVAAAFAFAYAYHVQATDKLAPFLPFPRSLVSAATVVLLILLAQGVYALLIGLLFRWTWPVWSAFQDVSWMNRLLGAGPGLIKGLAFTSIFLLPFALFPLVPPVSAAIERSSVASILVRTAVEQGPRVEELIGRDVADSLTYLSPPQTDEGQKINFGAVGNLAPDPVSEARMLVLVNQEREQAGLRALESDEALKAVARAHSQEMFELGYFAHNSPVAGSPFDRMSKAGIRFLAAGENLAYAPTVQVAHEGLMNSPGHRANILRPQFGKVGIGAIRSDFRGIMFSQEFTN
ncbi:MAG TPA: CvpA family protein [Chloroflexota bacterium]|nr:CvpA family protein [Chloroflexota bacterium]